MASLALSDGEGSNEVDREQKVLRRYLIYSSLYVTVGEGLIQVVSFLLFTVSILSVACSSDLYWQRLSRIHNL